MVFHFIDVEKKFSRSLLLNKNSYIYTAGITVINKDKVPDAMKFIIVMSESDNHIYKTISNYKKSYEVKQDRIMRWRSRLAGVVGGGDKIWS